MYTYKVVSPKVTEMTKHRAPCREVRVYRYDYSPERTYPIITMHGHYGVYIVPTDEPSPEPYKQAIARAQAECDALTEGLS